MIKFRQAYYCNLKVLLLCLVIYGHMIEPQREYSDVVYQQYRWIYLLHMPLFAFLSGLFLQNKEQCLLQLKKYFPLYVVSQVIAVLAGGGQITIITPFWHLWYLLSLCFWLGAGWLWFRYLERNKMTKKKWILGGTVIVLSVLLGAVIGYIPWINRAFSVSRTIVFFPSFLPEYCVRQKQNGINTAAGEY